VGQFITPDVLPEDTFCRVLLIPNDPKWIGVVSGALLPMVYPSEWVSIGGITPEEAAERSQVMLDEFWNSSGCGDIMNCCEDRVQIKRFDPDTGRPQVSFDGGETWQEDPADIQNQIQVLPPIVVTGGSSTKCDAATNASEHINELITATGENLETASTVFALAIGVAEAILALFLIIVSAGTLAAPVTAVATAIWAAATGVFNLGIAAYNAYWTVDKQDAILCALFCNIGEDGQFTEAQYQAFRTKVKEQLPASPALDIVMTAINAGGARGLSQMASYGNAAEADCSSCECVEGCGYDFDLWNGEIETFGVIVERAVDYLICDLSFAPTEVGEYFLRLKTGDVDQCCNVASYEIISGGTINISVYTLCGDAFGTNGHTLNTDFGSGSDTVNTITIGSTGACRVKFNFV